MGSGTWLDEKTAFFGMNDVVGGIHDISDELTASPDSLVEGDEWKIDSDEFLRSYRLNFTRKATLPDSDALSKTPQKVVVSIELEKIDPDGKSEGMTQLGFLKLNLFGHHLVIDPENPELEWTRSNNENLPVERSRLEAIVKRYLRSETVYRSIAFPLTFSIAKFDFSSDLPPVAEAQVQSFVQDKRYPPKASPEELRNEARKSLRFLREGPGGQALFNSRLMLLAVAGKQGLDDYDKKAAEQREREIRSLITLREKMNSADVQSDPGNFSALNYLISGGAGWLITQLPFSLTQGFSLRESMIYGIFGLVVANSLTPVLMKPSLYRGKSIAFRNWAYRHPWNLNFAQMAIGTTLVNCAATISNLGVAVSDLLK